MWQQILHHIQEITQEKLIVIDKKSVGGGCINQGYVLQTNLQKYFVKINQADLEESFVTETLGLQQIQETQSIRVPQPLCWGTVSDSAYLVLEWLELTGSGGNSRSNWELMGTKLAAMHQFPVVDLGLNPSFGWSRNNFIGSTPQINFWKTNWAEFFAEARIGYQMKLAKQRGGNFPETRRVVDAVYQVLQAHQPQPSLVHGDLWGGNAAITRAGEPVIFDPASYVGDREVDLAMTKLFGGFPREFYQAYQQAFPLAQGYQQRETIYNLYHILNHFNLFGGGYGNQANQMMAALLQDRLSP
jgi:fructosamine-3-kinase